VDLNALGHDLDSFDGRKEGEGEEEGSGDGCYEVVENDYDFETCPPDVLAS
jgi:hypothetical protein